MCKTMKKTKTRTKTVHGWEGSGPTVAAAKVDAIKKIEKAAEGSYTPTVVRWRGMVGIVWRELLGHCYTILRPNEGDDKGANKNYCEGGARDEAETIRAMLRDIAQIGFVVGEDATAPVIITNEEDRRDHESWSSWQNGVKAYRDAHPEATEREWRQAGDEAQSAYYERRRSSKL